MLKNYLVRFYTPEGKSLIKNIKAPNLTDAETLILEEGYMPSFVLPNIFLDAINPAVNGGMKDAELSIFFNELHHLVKSTGSVGKAFSYMDKDIAKPEYSKKYDLPYLLKYLYYSHKQSKIKNRKKLIKKCIYLLDKGERVKETFALNNFEEIVLSLIDLAESTGDYSESFLKISEYFETKNIYKKNIIGTLAYPLFLFLLLFIAFSVFLYYVVPTFSVFFKQFPNIPLSTVYTLKLFRRLKNIFIYITFFAAVIFTSFLSDLLSIKTKAFSFLQNIPQLKNIINYSYLNWIFYQFSLMISSGVTVNAVFDYFGKNSSKIYFRNKFKSVYQDLISGNTLFDSLHKADFLPVDAVESIRYGEIGGFLSETVLRLSKEFKEKADRYMKIFTKGLFLLAMAGVVFFLLLMFFSLFLPLIQGMVGLSANY
jgi:type IV pilus assembly protein PilC